MAPANIFLALLDSASIAHDVARLEALKANAKTEDVRAPTSSEGEYRHAIPYGAQTAPEQTAPEPEASAPPPPTKTASAPPPPPDAVGAGWLLERCRALDSAVGAAELACGCVDAAKKEGALTGAFYAEDMFGRPVLLFRNAYTVERLENDADLDLGLQPWALPPATAP